MNGVFSVNLRMKCGNHDGDDADIPGNYDVHMWVSRMKAPGLT